MGNVQVWETFSLPGRSSATFVFVQQLMCVNNCAHSLDVLKRVVGLLYPPPKVEPLGLVVPPSLESCQRVAWRAPRAAQGARGDFWPPVPQCICSSIRLGKAKPAGEWNNGSLLGPCSQNIKRGLSFQLRELVIGWILRCKKRKKKSEKRKLGSDGKYACLQSRPLCTIFCDRKTLFKKLPPVAGSTRKMWTGEKARRRCWIFLVANMKCWLVVCLSF